MSLRGQVPDAEATYQDPVLGVNLHEAREGLQAGEAEKMQNLVHYGGLVSRNGSVALNASALASSKAVTGGHKYYYGTSSSKRLITYDTKLVSVTDGGSQTQLNGDYDTNDLTTDVNTHFFTWPITDKVYIANGTDLVLTYDGTEVLPLGFINIRNATYKWTLSANSSSFNDYYLELNAGGDPGLDNPLTSGGVWEDGALMTKASSPGLSAGEWDWADNDGLGYSTIYIYLTDGSDPDTKASGFVQCTQGANPPGLGSIPAARQVMGLVDRLFAITSNGIERTSPRDPTVWSLNSSWATFRPSRGGNFRAMAPHMVSSQEGIPVDGAIAVTENAYYFFTGNDFGDDASNATASTGEDASIRFVDHVGTFGPRNIVGVPGVGTFWITNTRNVFYVPTGHTRGVMVGTRIINTGGSATKGLEELDVANGDDCWLIYHEPYLMLGYRIVGETNVTRQYWMDLNKFRVNTDIPVWYGPMTGQSLSCVWQEIAQGDYGLYGGEGDASEGIFVYQVREPSTYTDTVGDTTNDIDYEYRTYLKSGGAASREKYVEQIEFEMDTLPVDKQATCDIADITGTILANIPLERTFV